ncbi:hypothetical protein Q3G72_023618 [Acer saccharum]|nr:hypothetical protein Q3G72_023618 [Acer saccharum]
MKSDELAMLCSALSIKEKERPVGTLDSNLKEKGNISYLYVWWPLVAAGLSSPPSPQLSSSSSSSSPPALAAAIANLSHRRHHLHRFHLIFGRFGSQPPRKADLALFAATGGRLAIWRRLSSRRI